MPEEFLDRLDDRRGYEWAIKKQDPNRPNVTVLSIFLNYLVPYMSTVFALLIDLVSLQVEQGFYCASCLYVRGEPELFTRGASLDHPKDCRVQSFHRWWCLDSDRLVLELEGSECD
jgi:hypothetical protein